MTSQEDDPLDIRSFEERVDELLAGPAEQARRSILTEYDRWHGLHDRLVSIIAALIDDAVEQGAELAPLLERTRERTEVAVDDLVGRSPTPETVAALLRSHHSVGSATQERGTVSFLHQCGSGLAHWRRAPDTALLHEDEVPGVPAGVPRYCARCITTIHAAGAGHWRVSPPRSPYGEPCLWEVDELGGPQLPRHQPGE